MDRNLKSRESGQSLVFLAILMVVFLGILALVLDGGIAYFHRRNVQNAADAAALAAAGYWCNGGTSDQAEIIGVNYATEQNLADTATVIVPGGTVEDAAYRVVQANTASTFKTFFGSILGQDEITVVASAKSGCYPPSETGVLPIAWSCRAPVNDEGWSSDDCQFLYGNEENPNTGQIYLIMDSNKMADDQRLYGACQTPPTDPPDPDFLDCDIDNDGINDIMTGGERSWLDLDGGSSDAKELSDWIEGEPVTISTHLWLVGTDGGKTAVYQAAETKEGQDVILPVYSQNCDMKVDPNGAHTLEETVCYQDYSAYEGRSDPKLGESTAGNYVHIISFAVFHVLCVSDKPSKYCETKQAAIEAGLADDNTFSIEGYFVRGYIPEGNGGPNDLPWVGAFKVYLID